MSCFWKVCRSDFRMPAAFVDRAYPAAFEALRIEGGHDYALESSNDLVGLLEQLGWGVELDDEGSIVTLSYDDDAYPDDDMWIALAPYVREGSQLVFVDEYRERTRWRFTRGDRVVESFGELPEEFDGEWDEWSEHDEDRPGAGR